MGPGEAPTIDDVRAAAQRIAPYVHRTPVLTCTALDAMCGGELFFKCECFQKVGAFKARGATNAVFSLSDAEAVRGVATHSSGNHAAALAYAARCRGTTAYVAMPSNAPEVKKRAVAGYGAEIVECEPTLEAREATLRAIVERTGAVFVPPYNDHRVIAGQGTAALELLDEVTDLDAVIAPVGGGGLLGGTAITVASLSPETLVFGAEPQQADDAYRSFHAGRIMPATNPTTIADGLRTSLGTLTFPIIRRHVRDIITVSEDAIVDAMRHIWQRMKVLVEPSAAVPVAVLLEKRDQVPGRRIGIILSGGNADLDHLPW